MNANQLTYLPESICNLTSLKTLYLLNNPLPLHLLNESIFNHTSLKLNFRSFSKNRLTNSHDTIKPTRYDKTESKKKLEDINGTINREKPTREEFSNNEIKEKKSKSVCFTPIPINAALKAADDWLGKDLPWFPVNETQKEYLEKFFEKETAEYDFVKRTASNIKSVIQKFLADNGFPDFDIPDIDPKLEFYIAGIIDQIVEWLQKGETTKMKGQDGHIYDAVEFKENKGFIVSKSIIHPHPIATLHTKSEDNVYITFLDNKNDRITQFGFKMIELAQSITNDLKEFMDYSYGRKQIDVEKIRGNFTHFYHIIIPKIDFEGDVNIDWIVKMKTVDRWFISWAAMKGKLRLNHLGARAQAAVIMVKTRSVPPPPKILKFDRPFMIWFTHQGKVTFVLYASYNCWKDPGDDIFS